MGPDMAPLAVGYSLYRLIRLIVRRAGLARALTERAARLHVDGRRPDRSVFFAHAAVRRQSRVLVPPELEVGQVLGAGGQRPPTDPSRGRVAHLVVQEAQAFAHQRLRNAAALRGIDEAEESEMREQDAPVLAKAMAQPIPVERLRAG